MQLKHLFSSRRARLVLTAIVALSPLAYLGSVYFLVRNDPNTRLGLELGRNGLLRVAEANAASLGLDVSNWSRGLESKVSNDRHYYFRLHQTPEVEQIKAFVPPVNFQIVFLSPDGREKVQMTVDQHGHLLGFDRSLPSDLEVKDPGEAGARARAEEAFRSSTGQLASTEVTGPKMTEERKFNRVGRTYTWQQKFSSLPGARIETYIGTVGDIVVSRGILLIFENGYAESNLLSRSLAAQLAILPFVLFSIFAAIYGLIRYIKRSRQKEVSHGRSALVCVLMAAGFFLMAMQSDFLIFNTANQALYQQTLVMVFMLLVVFAMFLLLGALIGVAYGSGEGDVREAYPGKLTSLDAFLTGRLLSRNVGRAICLGAALGGWALLSRVLVTAPVIGRPDGGQGLAERTISLFFGHLNWAAPLLMPFFTLVVAVPGLLVPISFLHGRFRSQKLYLTLLSLISCFTGALIFLDEPSVFWVGLLRTILISAALLISFFAFDLLTAIVAISAPGVATFSVFLLSQPAPSLHRAGLSAVFLIACMLIAAAICWYRGREFQEHEVRPLYARNLAERLGMQAEVSAAREAQSRLMTATPPSIKGLQLVASCLPARVVGGDFYDFFVLDDHRIGLFVAEGGGQGLGSALTIAYAKGFLMPRIKDGYSPSELVCALQGQLASLLQKGEDLAFTFAMIDTHRNTLSYARTGHYPLVLTPSINGNPAHADRPLEQEQSMKLSSDSDAKYLIREATVNLLPDLPVVFLTDGLVQSVDGKLSIEKWAKELVCTNLQGKPGELQQKVEKALRRKAKRIRKAGLEDDLTVVIVRAEPVGAAE